MLYHYLQRTSDIRYIIEITKANIGTRRILISEDMTQMFQTIIEDMGPEYGESD